MISEGVAIKLDAHTQGELKAPEYAGTPWAHPEQVRLSQVIQVLNDRFGTNFGPADQLFFDSVVEQAKSDEEVRKRAAANTLDNFALAMKGKLRDAVVDRLEQNELIATRYLNEQNFEAVAFNALVKRIYDDLRGSRGVAHPSWPNGYFAEVVGSVPDLERPTQPELEPAESLGDDDEANQ